MNFWLVCNIQICKYIITLVVGVEENGGKNKRREAIF